MQPEPRRRITLGGIEFEVEIVSPTYTKLHPVSDPDWMLRVLSTVKPPGKKK